MARADHTGPFRSNQARSPLVVCRIAEFCWWGRQAVFREGRRRWRSRVCLWWWWVAARNHVFHRVNAAVLVYHGGWISRSPQLFFGFHKFLTHLHFLPLFFPCFDFTWVYIPSIWIIFLFFPVLSLLFHDILGVLQHLLLPKIKEVRRVCVEFECLFPIVPVRGEIVERWRSITRVVCF